MWGSKRVTEEYPAVPHPIAAGAGEIAGDYARTWPMGGVHLGIQDLRAPRNGHASTQKKNGELARLDAAGARREHPWAGREQTLHWLLHPRTH